MDIKEFHLNKENADDDFEMRHWWMQTRFDYLDDALKHVSAPYKVLEFGCGTGQNLQYLRTISQNSSQMEKSVGVDPALPENFSPKWLSSKDQLVKETPGKLSDFNILLAMDVIEHIEDDQKALSEWIQTLPEQAIVFITVPAFNHLFSYHDKYMGHFRRYTRSSLEKVCVECGLTTIKTTYAFGFAYPIVYLLRKVLRRGSDQERASDLKPENFLINLIFRTLGRIEHLIGGNPFLGTSVVGYFQKK